MKPRKSSASGGIRSAPGTPAATASLLGRPPPANPRRTVVFSNAVEVVEERLLGRCDRLLAVAAQEDGDVVLLELGLLRVAREAHRVEQGGRLRADVDRLQARPLGGNMRPEVRQPPRDGDPEPGRRRGVLRLQLRERLLEILARRAEVVGRDGRRHDRVMERRHEHLDAVVGDDLDTVEQVLLRRERRGRGRTRRRARVLVDEGVDPGRAGDRARCARERLAAGEAHQVAGRTRTSPSSIFFRFTTTFEKVSGTATCSLSV